MLKNFLKHKLKIIHKLQSVLGNQLKSVIKALFHRNRLNKDQKAQTNENRETNSLPYYLTKAFKIIAEKKNKTFNSENNNKKSLLHIIIIIAILFHVRLVNHTQFIFINIYLSGVDSGAT